MWSEWIFAIIQWWYTSCSSRPSVIMGKHIPRKNGKRVTKRASFPKANKRGLIDASDATNAKKKKMRPGKDERENPETTIHNAKGTMTMAAAKNLLDRQDKPKTRRGKRILEKSQPQIIENTKKLLVLKGNKTSDVVNSVLRDIAMLSKPQCKVFSRNNDVLPFEDVGSLEYFGTRNDCSLIAFGSHNKKRPNNLVLGRLYDEHVLDLYEFGVEECISIQDASRNSRDHRTKAVGSKPMMVFIGEQWESDFKYAKVQNLLLDTFRGVKVEKLNLKALDHVIACTVADDTIFIRVYTIRFKKSGSKVPQVELGHMGPFWNLSLRRTQLASDDLWNLACKQPKQARIKKTKNISETVVGDKVGRIHMDRQDLSKMAVRKVSALRNFKKKST